MSRYEPRAYKRLTDTERAEAVAIWEAGSSTIEDLAGRFDCSPRALLYLFKRQGVTKGSKAATFAAEIRAEIFADELGDREEIATKGKATRAETFADASKIQRLIMSQIQLAEDDPSQASKVGASVKMLERAISAIQRCHSVRWAALGLTREDDGDELPIIEIRDLTDDDLAELRRRNEEAVDDDN